ncbi:hypothetical protein ZWY2020_054976 [Hordeum vulgare]|nr:hypothetical protein ZWY2020_054976 [Hordeum vulgare]
MALHQHHAGRRLSASASSSSSGLHLPALRGHSTHTKLFVEASPGRPPARGSAASTSAWDILEAVVITDHSVAPKDTASSAAWFTNFMLVSAVTPIYGTEYIYPQGTLNPYVGQQYVPIYGVSAAANTANQQFSQLSPSISGGGNGYPMMHGYSNFSLQRTERTALPICSTCSYLEKSSLYS